MIPEFSQANRTVMLALLDGMMEQQGLGEFWETYSAEEQIEVAKATLLYAHTMVKFSKAWQDAHQPQAEKKDG